MIDLTLLEEVELAQLIDLAQDEFHRRKSGIGPKKKEISSEIPELVRERLKLAQDEKDKQEDESRNKLRAEWDEFREAIAKIVGKDLIQYIEKLPISRPQHWHHHYDKDIYVRIPGLAIIRFTLGIDGGYREWRVKSGFYVWRDSSGKDYVTITDFNMALLEAQKIGSK